VLTAFALVCIVRLHGVLVGALLLIVRQIFNFKYWILFGGFHLLKLERYRED